MEEPWLAFTAGNIPNPTACSGALWFFTNRQDSQTRLEDTVTGDRVSGVPVCSFRTGDLKRTAGSSTHTSDFFLRG